MTNFLTVKETVELVKLRKEFVDKTYPGLFTCERNIYINRKTIEIPKCQCSCQNPNHKCQYGILCPVSLVKVDDQIICAYCYDQNP